jgi:hypothetical protein
VGTFSNNPAGSRPRRRSRAKGFEIETFVVGDKEVDALLNGVPIKAQKKYLRKATRKAMRESLKDFRRYAPRETGALAASATVRAIKRSRTQVGHQIHIDREKLILERAARGGKVGYDSKRGEPFFYAAAVEFDPTGPKPLREALYGNAKQSLKIVIETLQDLLHEAASKARAQIRDAIAEISAKERSA